MLKISRILISKFLLLTITVAFQAFVTIRLIILGSLAGRLFGYAEDHTICDSPQNLTEALQYAEYLHEQVKVSALNGFVLIR